jgi:hypothetical protein
MPKKSKAAKKSVTAKKPETAKVNKSQTVRDYVKEHPGVANKDVAEALSKQGIKLTANHVANIKSKMAAGKGKRKRRQKAAEVASVKTGIGIPEIKAAFGLLKQCGGITQAKEALAAAAEIQKVL